MSYKSYEELRQLLNVLIAIAVIILFVLKNPNKEAHENEIKNTIIQQDEIFEKFGSGWIASKMVTYHSYGFSSVTKYENIIVTIGILGIVFQNE